MHVYLYALLTDGQNDNKIVSDGFVSSKGYHNYYGVLQISVCLLLYKVWRKDNDRGGCSSQHIILKSTTGLHR